MQEIEKPRGAPAFAPTKRQRKDVMLFIAGGMSEPAIASVIGICQNTLRKHFRDELAEGRAKMVALNLRRLQKAADKGNVTAMRHLDQKFGSGAADPEMFKPKPPKLGKKEEAAQAAEGAATGRYATPPPPRTAADTVQ